MPQDATKLSTNTGRGQGASDQMVQLSKFVLLAVCRFPWQCLIVDEGHRLKNPSSVLYGLLRQVSQSGCESWFSSSHVL